MRNSHHKTGWKQPRWDTTQGLLSWVHRFVQFCTRVRVSWRVKSGRGETASGCVYGGRVTLGHMGFPSSSRGGPAPMGSSRPFPVLLTLGRRSFSQSIAVTPRQQKQTSQCGRIPAPHQATLMAVRPVRGGRWQAAVPALQGPAVPLMSLVAHVAFAAPRSGARVTGGDAQEVQCPGWKRAAAARAGWCRVKETARVWAVRQEVACGICLCRAPEVPLTPKWRRVSSMKTETDPKSVWLVTVSWD